MESATPRNPTSKQRFSTMVETFGHALVLRLSFLGVERKTRMLFFRKRSKKQTICLGLQKQGVGDFWPIFWEVRRNVCHGSIML